KIEQAFDNLQRSVRQLGISELYYVDRVASEPRRFRLTFWNPALRLAFDQSKFVRLMNATGSHRGGFNRINWRKPEILPTPEYKAFYDFLEYFKRLGEASYWFKDTPRSATVISFCNPGGEIPPELFYSALGPSVVFHIELRKTVGEANRRLMSLSETEETYLHCLHDGSDHAEIATAMNVSRNWVAKVCMRLRRKLGAASDVGAVARARDLHLLE
ncbi:MAG: LuxR C-terminal-related transcriptional regulator, partial [Pseudomonadota bacterium]